MTPEEVLEKAADYINEHGWTQGSYLRGNGSVCAVGAIGKVTNGVANGLLLRGAAYGLLRKANDGIRLIEDWNDTPGRTAEDVVLAMKRAAHHEGEQ